MEKINQPRGDDGVEPLESDAYALAYICGGTGGLLTLYLFELLQKDHLIVVEIKKLFWTEWRIVVADKMLPTTELSDISRELLLWFSEPQRAVDTYQRVFPRNLKSQCLTYRNSLFGRKLLSGWLAPERQKEFWTWAVGISIGLWLAAGLLAGWPLIVDFAISWAISAIVLSGIIYWSVTMRLSSKGKRFVMRLKNKFDHLREKSISEKSNVLDDDRRLAIAVFGVSALHPNSFHKFLDPLNFYSADKYGTENGGASEDAGG